MGVIELFLVAFALSMDAFAVGLTNGMTDSKMKIGKILLIAGFYGFFQAVMPLIGFFSSGVFSALIEKIAPWLSFALLALIGGKMLWDGVKEFLENKKLQNAPTHARENAQKGEDIELNLPTLTAQAVATSIDALAVGITFFALSTANTLCLNIWLDCLIIGLVTFALSALAVFIGKAMGNKLADKASIAGGVVLIVIGIKILLEGIL